MRNEIRRKILVDLFASPLSLIPVVGGLTGVIFSWIIGSVPLAAVGFLAALVGVGVFTSRLIWNQDEISRNATEFVLRKTEEDKNKILDDLEQQLKQDRDPRPEKCLGELRSLYSLLKESQKEDGNTWVGPVIDDFERVFEICVKQIAKTDELWRTSRTMNGVASKTIKRERERIVQEIEATTLQLMQTIEAFKTQSPERGESELADAKKELERTIEVAKKVDQRLADLGKGYDLKEFE